MLEKASTLETHDAKNEIEFFSLNLEEQRASGREKKTCFPNIARRLYRVPRESKEVKRVVSLLLVQAALFVFTAYGVTGHCEEARRRKRVCFSQYFGRKGDGFVKGTLDSFEPHI